MASICNRLTSWVKIAIFILRRDRWWLPLWIVGCVTLATFFTPMITDMAGTPQDQQILYETMKNPAMVAMMGVVYGTEYTVGIMYSQFLFVWSALLVAVMNVFFVVRHTRTEEEEGRLEMLGALPMGRSANVFAVIGVAFFYNCVIALLTGTIMIAFGVEGIGIAGSMLFGCALGACGFVFASFTLFIAQLASDSKGALGLSMALLGFFFLLRAVGDLQEVTAVGVAASAAGAAAGVAGAAAGVAGVATTSVPALISPLGLAERCYIFYDNNIWPVLVLAAEGLLFTALAFALNGARDLGAGLLPQRKGRAHASTLLGGPFSLAWRLSRGTVIAWVLIVFALGASYGSVFGDMQAFYESNELYAAVIGAMGGSSTELMQPVIVMLMLIMASLNVIPVCMVMLKLKGEENRGRMDQLYATSLSRVRFMAAFGIIAALLALVLQVLVAVGMWLAAYATMVSPVSLELLVKAALAYLPGVLFFAGIAALLLGVLPKGTTLVWIVLVYTFVLVYIGGVLKLPEWMTKASPFGALARYPVDAFEPLVAGVVCGGALVLGIVGLVGYRRREIKG